MIIFYFLVLFYTLQTALNMFKKEFKESRQNSNIILKKIDKVDITNRS